MRVNEARFQMTTTIRRVGHQDRECLRSTVGDHDCNQAASDEISVGARAQSICNDATRPNLIRRRPRARPVCDAGGGGRPRSLYDQTLSP